jgi:ribonuclease HII
VIVSSSLTIFIYRVCIEKIDRKNDEYIFIIQIEIMVSLQRFYKDDASATELCLDEVGRGCLFGRVYVACVVLPKDVASFDGKDIKDSKKFSSKKKLREKAEYIKEHALAWTVAYADADYVDKVNILQATMQTMAEAIKDTLVKLGQPNLSECLAVVDGNYFHSYRTFDEASEAIVEMPYVTVEQGDAKYMGIAAASILAKAARDDWILELCAEYPILQERYGMATNMGYGTAAHLAGIREHGITQWHRKTFGEACKNAVLNKIE